MALSPPVNWLRRRMRRGFAIAIVYLGLLLVPILLIALIVPPLITEGNNFADNVPTVRARRHGLRPEEQDAARDLNEDYDITSKLAEGGRASCRAASAAPPGRCATSGSGS